MTQHRVLSLLSGLALGAAVTGAASALTAMPIPFILAFGSCGAWFVFVQSTHRWSAIALLVCGIALGAALPRSAPQTSGAVVTHAVRGSEVGDLFALLDRIDADPGAVVGLRVTVSGEWSPAVKNRVASVSRRVMTCCAADAVRVGFDVIAAQTVDCHEGTLVRVTGILTARLRDGEMRYALVNAAVTTVKTGSSARI
jgi:hypothetical protein